MRIAVVAPTSVPPVVGGAERLYDGLVRAFNDLPEHEAELVQAPAPEHSFRDLVESYDRFRMMDLSAFDLVVSTKYPSWMARHDRHVVYMLHTLRGLYDSYHYFGLPTTVDTTEPEVRVLVELLAATPPGTEHGAQRVLDTARWVIDCLGEDHPASSFPGPLVRAVIRWLDHDALAPSRVHAHFAISERVAHRDAYFPRGVTARAIPPPSSLTGLSEGPFHSFFTASRLDAPKRIDLLISAMQHVDADVPLRIAGTGPDEQRLRRLRPDDQRITFLGHVTEEELREEYRVALAVPFVPLDEDFGLVAVEAQHAAKPVITCADSGGVTELVDDGVTGLVVDPNPTAIGEAMSALAADPARAEAMGRAGADAVKAITWSRVVSALLEPCPATTATTSPRARVPVHATRPRSRVVFLSTYAAHPAAAGGPLRLNRLARAMSERMHVDIISLDDGGGTPGRTELAPRLTQTVVEKSAQHRAYEAALAVRAQIPVGDISAALFAVHSPGLIQTIRTLARDAVGAVLAHPYMLPALYASAPRLPFVYDAHNAETYMKRELLAGNRFADQLVAVVEEVERRAVQGAELVVTCSVNDRTRLESTAPTLAEWALVPNGGDVSATPFVTGEARRVRGDRLRSAIHHRSGKSFEHLALFVASYHPPNLQAAETLVQLAPAMPATAFILAGSHGNHFMSRPLPPNVLVEGVLSTRSLRELLAATDVAVNPIQSGGGTNLKLIEYFAAGAPVVSSSLGCRGVDARDGDHLLVADGQQDLGAAITALLRQPDAAERRSANARKLAEARFDWHDLARQFSEHVDASLAGEAASRRSKRETKSSW